MDNGHVRQFLVVDRVGAIAGVIVVVIANGLIVQEPGVWLVLPALLVLVGLLSAAIRAFDDGRLLAALAMATAGNWLVAIVVSVVLPVLWPVMIVTVLVQVVLAAPHVPPDRVVPCLVVATLTAVAVGMIGLLNDEGGAIPDMDDTFEIILVVGSLISQALPLALLAWQNNRFTRDQVATLGRLNDMLVESQNELARSRRRVVEAGDAERQRIEKDLHDGAQQRLVALGVRLGLAADRVADDAELVDDLIDLRRSVTSAVEEIRQLAQGIFPTLLRNQGLAPAVRAAARRSPQVVEINIDDVPRLDETTESAMYFAAIEAMTNAAKHAPDADVRVSLRAGRQGQTLEVADDGPGFDVAAVADSRGFTNMRDRLDVVGGTLSINSDPGVGTTIRATSHAMGSDTFA